MVTVVHFRGTEEAEPLIYPDVQVKDRIEIVEVGEDLYDETDVLPRKGERGTVLALHAPDTGSPRDDVYDVRLDDKRVFPLIGWEFRVYERPVNDPAMYAGTLL